MRTFVILFLCISTFFDTMMGQPSGSEQKEIADAIALANGSRGKFNRPKAYETLTRYAELGSSRAMNALGLMHILGYVGEPDTVQAVTWLTKAGNAGFQTAWVNLGYMYKYAQGGVRQDLAKAFLYFDKAAQSNAINGLYGAGYMLYKGLGCEQDYEKAFVYFNIAASQNYSPAMYMLGLCYRNGYGTAQSVGEAQYWLAAADRLGYKFATDELEKETTENQFKSNRLRSVNAMMAPALFQKIFHLDKGGDIAGDYEGILVIYDWSGTNILKEKPLTLHLETQGNRISGLWIESSTDTARIFAERKADGLQFSETQYYRADHYTMNEPTLFNFEKAEIQVSEDDNGTMLNGNIRMFSPETMEPERPMYISLRRKVKVISTEKSKNLDDLLGEARPMTAYPVPYTNELNIRFTQTVAAADVVLGIYNTAGECVYFYTAGQPAQGEQRITISPPLAAGTYIIRLTAGTRSEQVVIISNGRTKP